MRRCARSLTTFERDGGEGGERFAVRACQPSSSREAIADTVGSGRGGAGWRGIGSSRGHPLATAYTVDVRRDSNRDAFKMATARRRQEAPARATVLRCTGDRASGNLECLGQPRVRYSKLRGSLPANWTLVVFF